MSHELVSIITSGDPEVRNRSLRRFLLEGGRGGAGRGGLRVGPVPPYEREPL